MGNFKQITRTPFLISAIMTLVLIFIALAAVTGAHSFFGLNLQHIKEGIMQAENTVLIFSITAFFLGYFILFVVVNLQLIMLKKLFGLFFTSCSS